MKSHIQRSLHIHSDFSDRFKLFASHIQHTVDFALRDALLPEVVGCLSLRAQ
jgi:hypothetical protein